MLVLRLWQLLKFNWLRKIFRQIKKKKKKNNNNIKPCTFSYKAFGSDMFSMDAKMQTE